MSAPLLLPAPRQHHSYPPTEFPGNPVDRRQGSFTRDAVLIGSACLVVFGFTLLGFGFLLVESFFPKGIAILTVGVMTLAAERIQSTICSKEQ